MTTLMFQFFELLILVYFTLLNSIYLVFTIIAFFGSFRSTGGFGLRAICLLLGFAESRR